MYNGLFAVMSSQDYELTFHLKNHYLDLFSKFISGLHTTHFTESRCIQMDPDITGNPGSSYCMRITVNQDFREFGLYVLNLD